MNTLAPSVAWGALALLSSAVVAAFVSLQFGLFILFFCAVAWWAWLKPVGAFYLFIIVAPLLPMLKITQTIGTITLLKDVIIAVLAVKLIVIPLITKQLPYRRNPFLLPVALLVGWTLVNVVRADDLILGILRAREILLYAILALIVLYLPRTRTLARHALLWFLASAALVASLSLYQWWFAPDSAVLRFDPVREIWIPRLSSVLAHPSIFGEYLVGVASLALAGVVSFAGRWRWIAALGFGVTLPLIFLTYSRAVWLGVAAAAGSIVVTFLWHTVKKRSNQQFVSWLTGAGVTALVAILLLWQFTSFGVFVRTAIDPTYGSNQERLEFLARLIAPMTNTEALLGRGLGDVTTQNFRSVPVSTFDVASGAARTVQLAKNATLVDNQFLKTFVELGFVGVMLSLWLYGLAISVGWQLARSHRHAGRVIGYTTIGFVTAFCIQAFFIDIWDIFPTNAFFWIVLALAARNRGAISDTDPRDTGTRSQSTAASLVPEGN